MNVRMAPEPKLWLLKQTSWHVNSCSLPVQQMAKKLSDMSIIGSIQVLRFSWLMEGVTMLWELRLNTNKERDQDYFHAMSTPHSIYNDLEQVIPENWEKEINQKHCSNKKKSFLSVQRNLFPLSQVLTPHLPPSYQFWEKEQKAKSKHVSCLLNSQRNVGKFLSCQSLGQIRVLL